jgi:hypothetical protein
MGGRKKAPVTYLRASRQRDVWQPKCSFGAYPVAKRCGLFPDVLGSLELLRPLFKMRTSGAQTIEHFGRTPTIRGKESAGQDSPIWCNVVNIEKELAGMKGKTKEGKNMKIQSGVSAVRASISFPPDIYKTLEDIARQKKVSLAWVVRDAAERYITEKWPLFGKQE